MGKQLLPLHHCLLLPFAKGCETDIVNTAERCDELRPVLDLLE
jgi:hypothetical protein